MFPWIVRKFNPAHPGNVYGIAAFAEREEAIRYITDADFSEYGYTLEYAGE